MPKTLTDLIWEYLDTKEDPSVEDSEALRSAILSRIREVVEAVETDEAHLDNCERDGPCLRCEAAIAKRVYCTALLKALESL